MNQDIFRALKNKGINVPEQHYRPLLAQWQAFQQLKSNPALSKFADFDIGLKHVPGGQV